MGLRGLHFFMPAPWLWLYITASLVTAANAVMSSKAYELIGYEYLGLAAIGLVVGMVFGQVSLAALWAAWGPSTWRRNYAAAIGSLGWFFVLSCVAALVVRDDMPRNILLLEATTALVLLSLMLSILHLLRRIGGWRLLQHGGVALEAGRFQLSLRGILTATAVAAVFFAVLRWRSEHEEFLRDPPRLAWGTASYSLMIGTTLVAPWFFFFAIVYRRRRIRLVVLSLALGYVFPAVVYLLLVPGDPRESVFWLWILLPLQLGEMTVGGLGLAMLHAAGVRATTAESNPARDLTKRT